MAIFLLLIAHWYLSLFTQTFFNHRYAAHAMFSMSRSWEKFFFVFSWLAQGSSYLSPNTYGILHRMHHTYADTEKDPHSPKFDDNLFTMMWRTKLIYSNIFYKRVAVEERFSKGVPSWESFDKFADSWPVRLIWGGIYIALYVILGAQWWMYFLLPLHFFMGPIHGAIINWFAHKYGYRNFEVKDTSRNIMPVDIFMLGEGFHNNHHHNGKKPNFGHKWWELDPVFPFILLFNKLRIIQLESG